MYPVVMLDLRVRDVESGSSKFWKAGSEIDGKVHTREPRASVEGASHGVESVRVSK